jgi:hypothetical protein
MGMEVTFIYELSKNGIPFYIGKTKNPYSREDNHKLKHGKDIEFNIIDSVNSFSKEKWKPLETFWIVQYKAWGFDLTNGNNGGGGMVAKKTAEEIEKQRKEIFERYKLTPAYEESRKKYRLKVYEKNKDKRNDAWNKWYNSQSEEVKQSRREKRKEYNKQYLSQNKDKNKEYQKKYREKNKK